MITCCTRSQDFGEGEIFRTRPDRFWGPLSLLYNRYQVSFPAVKRPGRGGDHPSTPSAEIKERIELYLYFLSGHSWAVVGWTLPLPAPLNKHVTQPDAAPVARPGRPYLSLRKTGLSALVTDLPLQKHRFNFRPVNVGFVADKVEVAQAFFFSEYFGVCCHYLSCGASYSLFIISATEDFVK